MDIGNSVNVDGDVSASGVLRGGGQASQAGDAVLLGSDLKIPSNFITTSTSSVFTAENLESIRTNGFQQDKTYLLLIRGIPYSSTAVDHRLLSMIFTAKGGSFHLMTPAIDVNGSMLQSMDFSMSGNKILGVSRISYTYGASSTERRGEYSMTSTLFNKIFDAIYSLNI